MTVAFIGHRKIENIVVVKAQLADVVTALIQEGADIFLFGGRGKFDSMCYDVVSELKSNYPHVRRVRIRAEYEYISQDYENFILRFYEETLFPNKVSGAGVLSYIVRNQAMVDACDVLVTYCDADYQPPQKPIRNTMPGSVFEHKSKSGTVMAVQYAQQKKKRIINLFETQ